jgi:Ca2+-binding EF-hand superfamily protein
MKATVIAASVAFALLPPAPAAAQQSQQQAPQQSQQQSQNPAADQKSGAAAGGSATRGVPVQQGQTRQQKFKSLDKNGDGKISRDEAQASPELMMIFVPTDTDSDGTISVIEFEAVPLVQPDGSAVQ